MALGALLYSTNVAAAAAGSNSGDIDLTGYQSVQIIASTTAVTGTTPTASFVLQHKMTDVTYPAVAIAPNLTAAGQSAIITAGLGQSPSSTTLATNLMVASTPWIPAVGLVRVVWTIAGTTPAFTFRLEVYGR